MTIVDPTHRRQGARPVDFRRPNKLNRDHLRNLEIVFETFARQFTTLLSSTLRAVCQVELRSIEQQTFDEFVATSPNPTHLVVLSMRPLPGAGALHLPLPLAFTLVDMLLGGHGGGAVPPRALTDIEVALTDTLLERVLAELTYAFESVQAIHPHITGHEANPQFAQLAAPTDMTVVIELGVRIDGLDEVVSLCLPYTMLQPVLEQFSGHLTHQTMSPLELRAAARAVEDAMLDVGAVLTVELPPVTLSPVQILALRPGDVIPFRVPAADPILGSVGGRPTFHVRPARRGKRLAAQVVDLIQPPKEQR